MKFTTGPKGPKIIPSENTRAREDWRERANRAATGARPDMRVVLKVPGEQGNVFVPIAAYWGTGFERSGGLDSRVAKLSVTTTDGHVYAITRREDDGRAEGGFVNLYLESERR